MVVPQRGQGVPPLRCTRRKSRTSTSNLGGTRRRSSAMAQPGTVRTAVYSASTSSTARLERFRRGASRASHSDLVGIAVADTGHEGLVLEQVLQLAPMRPDALAPHLDAQGRIVGVGTQVVPAGDRSLDALGHQVDLAHLRRVPVTQLDRPIVRRQPRRAARPGRGIGWTAGPAAEGHHEHGLGKRLRAGRRHAQAAGQHQVHHDPIRSNWKTRNLPRRRTLWRAWPTSASSSGCRAPDDQRLDHAGCGRDGPSGEGCVGGIREDVEVRQLGHLTIVRGTCPPNGVW